MDILAIEHLIKQYQSHKAVDDISFSIPQGCVFGLLGPNGAGKTTLLRMVTGILFPDSGTIEFYGRTFNASKDIQQIGYMPEERGLYKKMKVGEHILYLAQLKGMQLGEARNRAYYWVRKLELTEWWNKKVGDLSKGMQQKVQFISTILHEPKLLILDEPFSGLDPINTNLIKDEILELSKNGTAVIFSTHRMEQVEEICSQIVLVNKGKKILDGTVDGIRQMYKKHIFELVLDKEFSEASLDHEIADLVLMDKNKVQIKLKDTCSNNQLLEIFIRRGYQIHSFKELLPSINQVFIEQVQLAGVDLNFQ